MTLTTPHCPVAETMPGEVELRVASVPGVRDAEVNLVWDPPWDPGKMRPTRRASNWGCCDEPTPSPPCAQAPPCILTPRRRAAHCRSDGQSARRRDRRQALHPAPRLLGPCLLGRLCQRGSAFDEKIDTPGGVFYIDGASVLYLIGSTMDWVEDDFTAGFVFENPNAKGACGCGESFMV